MTIKEKMAHEVFRHIYRLDKNCGQKIQAIEIIVRSSNYDEITKDEMADVISWLMEMYKCRL